MYQADFENLTAYLQCLPGYPFDSSIDDEFVSELLADFPAVDVLDQVKAFRWYHNGNPAAHNKNLRLAIRRWLANARTRPPEPF
jgi:hypothetical protein